MSYKMCQFTVWEECNNKCTYCRIRDNDVIKKTKKLKNLSNIRGQLLNDKFYKMFNAIGFIGGEFFQGQLRDKEVKEKFFELFHLVKEKYNVGLIKEIWITTTLTIGDQQDLYSTLDILKDCNVWVCTSYDIIGRFHTPKMLENWEYHMKKIHDEYPNVKLNTTTIISGYFVEKYLNGEFNIDDFCNKYNTSLYIKQPTTFDFFDNLEEDPYAYEKAKKEFINKTGLNDFFPNREEFICFLIQLKNDNIDIYNKFLNNELRSEYECSADKMDLVHRDREQHADISITSGANVAKCGHDISYSGYKDCNECMVCDKLGLGE